MESNKNLVDKIMMLVSIVGKSNFYLSSTELDSRANMVVFVKQAFVFRHIGQYANVQDFSKKVKGLLQFPTVDSVIAYYCTSSGETYLLVVINSLCVPTIDINLIPPFVFREAGLILNDTPKIYCKYPSAEHRYLFDEEIGPRIQFTLNGTLSIFETSHLTKDEIEDAENYPTIFLTTDSNRWDP